MGRGKARSAASLRMTVGSSRSHPSTTISRECTMATQDLFSKLPIASIVALIAAGIGTALWYRVPLEVSRPPAPHIEQKHPQVLQSIDARLWEDPLQVLTRHETEPGYKPDPDRLTAARVCGPIVG